MESPFCSVVLGDFNGKCNEWWIGDLNDHCGLQLDTLCSLPGSSQLAKEPTNLEPNLTFVIHSIFSSQPNLVSGSAVHPSLHQTCHHQIIYEKIDLKVFLPPPYDREVWSYNQAEVEHINRAISLVDLENMFLPLDASEQAKLFNEILLNIFSNFIPRKTIKFKFNEPPLFVNNSFEKKIKNHFANQCTVLNNDSVLPKLTFASDCRINNFLIQHDDVIRIIRDLNPAKADGYDGISIRMIKMCDVSIVIPLRIIFNKALTTGVYSDIWKRGNVVPVHRKDIKTLVKNYRPISLLPIFGKIFEKIIYNVLFEHLKTNDILVNCQSGFLPGDSCISQLLSITHDIYKAFDGNPSLEVRGAFLDNSKAFDRVWHKGLLFKLKRIGIDGTLYLLLENYLKNRKQRGCYKRPNI